MRGVVVARTGGEGKFAGCGFVYFIYLTHYWVDKGDGPCYSQGMAIIKQLELDGYVLQKRMTFAQGCERGDFRLVEYPISTIIFT